MAESKKIVLLEDDRASCKLVSVYLQKRGYEVHETHEGRCAIELALKQKPDLLIADILLPDMHGSEAVKQLRASHTGKELKVLFLTSLLGKNGTPDTELKLTIEGEEFPALSKPFKPDFLADVVDRLTGGNN